MGFLMLSKFAICCTAVVVVIMCPATGGGRGGKGGGRGPERAFKKEFFQHFLSHTISVPRETLAFALPCAWHHWLYLFPPSLSSFLQGSVNLCRGSSCWELSHVFILLPGLQSASILNSAFIKATYRIYQCTVLSKYI